MATKDRGSQKSVREGGQPERKDTKATKPVHPTDPSKAQTSHTRGPVPKPGGNR